MTQDQNSALAFLNREPHDRNKNEQVLHLISGCIQLGICRGSEIRDAVASFGFDPGHVFACLKHGIKARHWSKASNGTYSIQP